MKFIFELNHPKHYYQFKYIMQELKNSGHNVLVLARDKDVLLDVLKEERVDYIVFGKHNKSLKAKILGTFALINNYIRIVRKYGGDVIVSKASFYGTFTAWLLRRKSVIFPDSEVVKVTNKYVVPICTKVVTPQSFALDYGNKHLRVSGLFEDCYLSPTVYQADSSVIEQYGLQKPYAVVRFVGWYANHDVGKNGFTIEEKISLIDTISKSMTVYVSSERELPESISQYKLPTPASRIHDVLSFADLYIGDSQTMATEAALLGTPAIRSNSFVGPNDMSNFKMLETKYGLLHNIAEYDKVLALAKDMSNNSCKKDWMEKRALYYKNVGNVNDQIVNILANI